MISERLEALASIQPKNADRSKALTALLDGGARSEADASDERVTAVVPHGPLVGCIVSIKGFFEQPEQ